MRALLLALLPLAGCAMPAAEPATPGTLEAVAARYVCGDGTAFTARFDRAGEAAVLTFAGGISDDPDATEQDRGFRVAITTQRPASGLWYAGGGWSLRGKGDEATLTRPDGRTSACRAGGGPPGRAGDI